jgi:hypothetical protein
MEKNMSKTLATLLLLAPFLAPMGCSQKASDSVTIDQVISKQRDSKSDLVGSLWNCKASCDCDGSGTKVRYASCSATDLEAQRDSHEACGRACSVSGLSSSDAPATSVECEPADEQCYYVSEQPVDMAYTGGSSTDGGSDCDSADGYHCYDDPSFPYPDMAYSQVDMAQPNP